MTLLSTNHKKSHCRFKIPVGTIQEWHLLNSDTEDGHPLHMHINQVQV